ncbi:MAG: transcriptional regulator CysB, partial [Cytophagaceae bacterium]
LVAIDASHLFRPSTTKIGFRRGTFIRGFMFEFIELFAPHLTKDVVNEAFNRHSKIEIDELFVNVKLPHY